MAAQPSKKDRAAIMQAVGEALEQERLGRAPTSRCPVCGGVLRVEAAPEVGVTYVSCGSGCTEFRMAHRPRPQGDA